MQYRLATKIFIIGALVIVLQMALMMIYGQVQDRQRLHRSVQNDIAQSAAGAETLIGPVLLIEYQEEFEEQVHDAQTGQTSTQLRQRQQRHLLPAQQLDWQGQAEVQTRHRGIYHANLFQSSWKLNGQFTLPAWLGQQPQGRILSAQAYLVLGVSDQRGITNNPLLHIDGRELPFQVGSREVLATPAIHASLGELDLSRAHSLPFTLALQLMGSQHLSIAPTAELTNVHLQSSWPHPSFQGRFLPNTREVRSDGYSASWQISHLARDFEQTLKAGKAVASTSGRYGHDSAAQAEVLGVSFIDPVNIYVQAERAVKYGLLFIVLTFAAFFLIETTRRIAIHPLQYLLVGLALSIFFLLLVALSEHLPFWLSYGIAALACVCLITLYLGAVLRNRLHGLAFGAGITALYGILYGILRSEDNALLMGSVLLFVALAALMLGTRHIDWYSLIGQGKASANPAPSSSKVNAQN
ncbi:cell envelope integrity protein CreD [Comamonadaceae bacterium OH2310_COT-174]|nr:cell envelope integrity protein CreD [Comamonadaceae bacterium OH2310_COT-174]